MARQSFKERYPYAGLFLVIAVAVAIPLTVFSLQNVSTQTVQHAQYLTPTPYYTPTPTPYKAPTPTPYKTPTPVPTSSSCSKTPSWSDLLGHTDGATSVKYKYSVKNNCTNGTNIRLTASRPTSSWNYQYSGCSVNTSCTYYISGGSSTTIYVTISRPTNANLGTYNITFKAALATNPSIYSTKTTSYIVTK